MPLLRQFFEAVYSSPNRALNFRSQPSLTAPPAHSRRGLRRSAHLTDDLDTADFVQSCHQTFYKQMGIICD
jgi:hypothetical protein